MEHRNYIHRLLFIIRKLRSAGHATFNEIRDYVMAEFEIRDSAKTFSVRTLQRDLNDIRELFNIEIKCNLLNQYYIVREDTTGFSGRVFESFDFINLLGLSSSLSPIVQFEKRRPNGTENLYPLVNAIKNRQEVIFSYQKFWDEVASQRTAEPLVLKEFKNRWYVLARDKNDEVIKCFALDRLTNLAVGRRTFDSPQDFNAEDYFNYSFGIIGPTSGKPQTIILSFDSFQGRYIKSLPLHESQEIIEDNDDELVVKLRLYVTHDLVMELLSYGDTLKVIKPASLARAMERSYRNALKKYL